MRVFRRARHHGIASGLADFITIPAVNTVGIESDIDPAMAALSEPLDCVSHSMDFVARASSARYRLDAKSAGTACQDRTCKTGRHCPPNAAAGKLDLIRDSGLWLRNDEGQLTKRCKHICWDGCMFPNAVMTSPDTWASVLRTMISVRDAHGWND